MLIAVREEGWGAAGRGMEGLNREEKEEMCVSSAPDETLTYELGE